jgi:hypothetical protein
VNESFHWANLPSKKLVHRDRCFVRKDHAFIH